MNSVEIDMTEHELVNSRLGALQYDPAPESAAIARLKEGYGLFIDGQFTDPAQHDAFSTLNPATGVALATVAKGSSGDVDRAVRARRGKRGLRAARSGRRAPPATPTRPSGPR